MREGELRYLKMRSRAARKGHRPQEPTEQKAAESLTKKTLRIMEEMVED